MHKHAWIMLIVLVGALSCSLDPWTYRPRVRMRGTFVSTAVRGQSADGTVRLEGVLHWSAAIRGTSESGVTLEGTLR